MSTVQDVINDIRVEINDTGSTRFTDDTTTILPIVKQAIRRANRICQRSSLHFAKKSSALTCVSGQNYVSMPIDLEIPIGIWRDDTHTKINYVNESDWETIVAASECANWFLDWQSSKIYFNGTPASAVKMSMWYYPKIDPSAYTVATTMPWSGILDDIISRYVSLRLQNIDEMDVSVDQGILADMEQSIVSTFLNQNPTIISGGGWI